MKTENKPLVSIITPTYNLIKNKRLDWFYQNLESVQNQTYEAIEHIIIDGASTDGTLDILNQCREKGWIKYYSEPDKGIYDALNHGILKAKGKYVVCLNSDDYYFDNEAVALEVEALEKSNADACYADTMGINAKDGTFVGLWKGKETFFPPFGEIPNHQTFMIKRDVMHDLGLYNLDYQVSADSNFIYKMVANKKTFVYVEKTLVGYRSGGYSDTHHEEVLLDQARSFKEFFAKKLDLNDDEIDKLAHNNFLSLPLDEAIKLGSKLKKKEWVEAFFARYFANKMLSENMKQEKKEEQFSFHNVLHIRCKAFHFLPLFKIKKRQNSFKIYGVGNVPLFSYKRQGGKRVWKVLILPIFKIRHIHYGKTVKFYLFNLPFLKVAKKGE